MSISVTFGLLSGLLSLFAYLPYLRDTLRGVTRPQRASWFIWTVLSMIAFAAQIAEGATQSLWFAGVQMGGTAVIFALSIKRGVGGLVNFTDCLILVAAALGLYLWSVTNDPAYALAISIGISLLGGSVTVVKAYNAPWSGTLSTWCFSFVASICAMVAAGPFDLMLWAYPMYLFLLNGAIVLAMLWGKSKAPAPEVSEPAFHPVPLLLARVQRADLPPRASALRNVA